MKWFGVAFALALACACALSSTASFAQELRDPLIVPGEGGIDSRFQIVGQSGWTPGASVTITLAFTAEPPPADFAGPFYHERQATVLRDGTWSFPISISDQLFPFALDAHPGYIVVRAVSGERTTTNTFIYSPNRTRPPGAETIANLGFGLPAQRNAALLTVALFLGALGILVTVSGAGRNSSRTLRRRA